MASKTTKNHNSSDVLTFELEGLEVRVSSNVKDDFEILEAAARVDDNPTAVIDLLKLLVAAGLLPVGWRIVSQRASSGRGGPSTPS